MSNITAGIGRGQLLHLEEHKARKKAIYEQYKEGFADIPEISLNPLNKEGDANCWLTGMIIKEGCPVTPDEVMDALAEHNIESRPVWKPMHLQPVFAECDFITAKGSRMEAPEVKDVAADVFHRGLCLPSDIKNTEEDMKLIIDIVRKCFGR